MIAKFDKKGNRNCRTLAVTLRSCPNCESEKFTEIRREYGPHYSEIRCQDCGRFITWGRSPHAVGREQVIAAKARWLLERPQALTRWEQEFLTNIQNHRKLSPKQSECLDRIYSRCGGAIADLPVNQEVG